MKPLLTMSEEDKRHAESKAGSVEFGVSLGAMTNAEVNLGRILQQTLRELDAQRLASTRELEDAATIRRQAIDEAEAAFRRRAFGKHGLNEDNTLKYLADLEALREATGGRL